MLVLKFWDGWTLKINWLCNYLESVINPSNYQKTLFLFISYIKYNFRCSFLSVWNRNPYLRDTVIYNFQKWQVKFVYVLNWTPGRGKCGRAETGLHAFFTSTWDRGDVAPSCPSRFNPKYKSPISVEMETGLVSKPVWWFGKARVLSLLGNEPQMLSHPVTLPIVLSLLLWQQCSGKYI